MPGDMIKVYDNGRGIPVDNHPKLGIPAVTVVLTVLHAGGKFGGSGYKVSGGLHGVGSCVVNALCEWLEVIVCKDSIFTTSGLSGACRVSPEIARGLHGRGSRITFKADPEIFTETTVYEYETLVIRLREQAFLNAGVRIELRDERDDNVLREFMIMKARIQFRGISTRKRSRKCCIIISSTCLACRTTAPRGIAMQYNESYNELILSFANNIHTTDGGTHQEGFKHALTRVINDFGR